MITLERTYDTYGCWSIRCRMHGTITRMDCAKPDAIARALRHLEDRHSSRARCVKAGAVGFTIIECDGCASKPARQPGCKH